MNARCFSNQVVEVMNTLDQARPTFERLAEDPSAVKPAEVSAALGHLYKECKDTQSRQIISEMGTCFENIVKLRPEEGWRSSYAAEAWGEYLLYLYDKLRIKLSRATAALLPERRVVGCAQTTPIYPS